MKQEVRQYFIVLVSIHCHITEEYRASFLTLYNIELISQLANKHERWKIEAGLQSYERNKKKEGLTERHISDVDEEPVSEITSFNPNFIKGCIQSLSINRD